MDEKIYQDTWNADQGAGGAGVRAILKGSKHPESGGFVEVSEAGSTSTDHKIITAVNIPEEKRETYRLCEQLFNNYTLDPEIREQVTRDELSEETQFIELYRPDTPHAGSKIPFCATVPAISACWTLRIN